MKKEFEQEKERIQNEQDAAKMKIEFDMANARRKL